MAINWRKAQEYEANFWKSIYCEKHNDVISYMPVTDEAALAFSQKSAERFGQCIDMIMGSVIIDVGCGPYGLIKGFQVYAERTGRRPKKIYGVDSLMDVYREFGTLPIEPYIECIMAKAESIPVADGSCNYVFSTNVIDHVEDPEKVLAECRRIVKTAGEVFIAVHIINFPFNFLDPFLFLVDRNHPHHFSEGCIFRLAQKHFSKVTLTRKVKIIEDHPEFGLASILKSPNRLRSLKRWLSTFLLSTCYFKCSK